MGQLCAEQHGWPGQQNASLDNAYLLENSALGGNATGGEAIGGDAGRGGSGGDGGNATGGVAVAAGLTAKGTGFAVGIGVNKAMNGGSGGDAKEGGSAIGGLAAGGSAILGMQSIGDPETENSSLRSNIAMGGSAQAAPAAAEGTAAKEGTSREVPRLPQASATIIAALASASAWTGLDQAAMPEKAEAEDRAQVAKL